MNRDTLAHDTLYAHRIAHNLRRCVTRRVASRYVILEGFMCGCKQWNTDINESNYNMQPITIKFAVRVRKDYTRAPCMFIWAKFGSKHY